MYGGVCDEEKAGRNVIMILTFEKGENHQKSVLHTKEILSALKC